MLLKEALQYIRRKTLARILGLSPKTISNYAYDLEKELSTITTNKSKIAVIELAVIALRDEERNVTEC
jgi:DNA-binding CsgD family transcriptional regulator